MKALFRSVRDCSRRLLFAVTAVATLGGNGLAMAAPPDPVVTSSVLVTNTAPILFGVNFGELVNGFDLTDINVTNGTAFNLVDAGSGQEYTFEVTPAADGDVTVIIPAASVQNVFLEDNTASTPAIVDYDTTGATPVLSSTTGSPTSAAPIVVSIDFGENTTGFAGNDLVITNGFLGNFSNIDGQVYEAEITSVNPTANTQITIELPADAATDVASNNSFAGNTLVVDYDPIEPTPLITSTATNPTAVSPIPISIDFGENVTALDLADLTPTNGAISNLQTADSQTWTLDITPAADGQVTLDVAAAAVQDNAGTDNPAGSFSITYSTGAPIPVITSAEGVATRNSPFDVTISFGQVVTGFDSSDLVVGNATVGATTPAGDADTFTVSVTPTAEGAVTIDIADAAAQTLSAVDTVAATQFSIDYDLTSLAPIVSTTEPDPTMAPSWVITVDYGEVVTGVTASSLISVEVGQPGPQIVLVNGVTTADGQVYDFTVTPLRNTVHEFRVVNTGVSDLAGNTPAASPFFTLESESPIELSGDVYDDLGDTLIGVGRTVSLLINGVPHPTSVLTDAAGHYEILDADIEINDVLTLYLDGNTEAGVHVFKTPLDQSRTDLDIYRDGLNVNGVVRNTDLDAAYASNSEVGRIYSTQATGNPLVASTESDLLPVDGTTLTVLPGGRHLPIGDVNPLIPGAADFTIDVTSGQLDLRGTRSRLRVSGDLLSALPGDDRGSNNEVLQGQILTGAGATNGSVILMGYEGSNTQQLLSNSVNLDAFEYGGASTPHTLCFIEDETYQFERFQFTGNPAPNQHLLRTCDVDGVVLNDGSQHFINATGGNYTVSDVDYRDSNNISGVAINPGGVSIDSGNNLAWLGAQVAGVIYDDLNDNGVQDLPTEPGIPNVEVRFYTDDGNDIFDRADILAAIPTVTTAADGSFSTNNVAATTYFVAPVQSSVEAEVGERLFTEGSEGLRVVTSATVPTTGVNFGYGSCDVMVTTGADTFAGDGLVSFAEALYCANDGDTIGFDASLDQANQSATNDVRIFRNNRNPVRDDGIYIQNRTLNINTVDTRELLVVSANLGNWALEVRPAMVISNATLHMQGMFITGGRSRSAAQTVITGTNSIQLEDVALHGSISRFGQSVLINGAGTVDFIRSRVSSNSARSNMLSIQGDVDVSFVDSEINNNNAGNNGGGPFGAISYTGAGDLIIRGTTIRNNSERRYGGGGAVYYRGTNAAAIFEVSNSSFLNNQANSQGGAIRFAPTVAVNGVISHTTIVGNTTLRQADFGPAERDSGAAGIHIDFDSPGTLTLRQTVVAGNSIRGGSNGTAEQIVAPSGAITYEQSFVGDEYRDGATVEVRAVPVFDAAAYLPSTAGIVQVMNPQCGSPVIDAGGVTSLQSPAATMDQLGRARRLGEGIDIGSVEYAGSSFASLVNDSAAAELYALGEEVLVTLTFCASVVYTDNGGDLTLGLTIAGQAKTAFVDVVRSAAAPQNQLVFRYVAEAGLLDLDGIEVVADSLALTGGATLRGPGDEVDALLTVPATLLPNSQVDTFPPVITFNDDIEAGPVGSDVFNVSVSDVQPAPATYAYGFSADAVCDISDSYPNPFVSGIPQQFNTTDNNGSFVCVVAIDAAGNVAFATSANDLNIDTTVPVISLTTTEPQRTSSNPITYTITFNEPVTGFDQSDLQVTNATITGFTAVSATEYVVTLEPPPSGGLIRVIVPANAATDSSGLGNDQASSFLIADVTRPQPIITIAGSDPTSSAPIQVSVDFGEAVNGFTLDDVVIANGIAGSLVNNGNRIFSFAITPSADGLISVDVPEAVAQDFVGLNNFEATQKSVQYDSTAPVPTVTATGPNPTNQAIEFQIVFDEAASGLDGAELILENATLVSLTPVDATTYTATVNAIADGEVTLAVPGGVAQDSAGNSNVGSNTASVVFDSTGPAPVISSVLSGPTNADTVPVTVSFGEPVTDFDESDLVLGNATIDPGSFSGSGASYTFNMIPSADGDVTVDIAAAVALDALGNTTLVAEQFVIVIDNSGPLPVLAAVGTGTPTSANPIPVSITFPEDVTGVELTDFVVTGGAAQNLSGGPAEYTFEIVPVTDGDVAIEYPASLATDLSGNASLVAVPLVITYDSTIPTPLIASTESNPTNAATFPITIVFQEPVTGFEESDLVFVNGSVVASSLMDSGDGMNFTANVATVADGELSISIPAGAAQDASLNPSGESALFTINVDNTAPSVLISSTESSPSNANPVPVTLVFSEAVTGVELAEIVVGNGTAANLATTDNITWTVDVTPTTDGQITVDYAAAQAIDAAGNDNTAATQFTLDIDSEGPTPVIASAITGPTQTSPIAVTVDFGEVVTGFNLADLVIGNGGVSNFTDLGGGQYSFDITPNNDGNVTVDIAAGAAQEATGNDSLEAIQFDIEYDGTPPTPVITSAFVGTTNASPIPITIDFGEDVTDFESTDIVVANAALIDFVQVSPQVYTANLIPASDGDITVDIAASVATDAVGFDNLVAQQFLVTYDSRVPVPVLASAAAPRTDSSPFSITIDFSPIEVSGFDVTDLTVVNGTASNVQTSDNITFTADITPTAEGTVEINVPGGAANSVSTGTVSTPASQLDVIYDVTPPTPVISSLESSPTGANPIRVTVDFGEPVTGVELSDLVIGNGSATNLVNVNDSLYTVDLVPVAGGDVTVDIAAAVAQDATARDNLAASTFTIVYNNGEFSIADITVNENDGTITLDVMLTGLLSDGATLTYTTVDGSAVAGDDYTAATGTVVFTGTDGETQSISLDVLADAAVEGDETFDVQLSGLTNALGSIADDTGTVTITDESRLQVEFAGAASSGDEDVGDNLPMLMVSGATITQAESVEVAITGGNARLGFDYNMTNPVSVIILPGDYQTPTSIAIPSLSINADAAFENDETIELALQNAMGNVVLADANSDGNTDIAYIYTIANDDLSIGPGGVAFDAQIWVKADAGTQITANGLTDWEDQSGNGNDVSVPAGVGFPQVSNDAINFNPVVNFNGEDYLSNSDSLLPDDGPYTKIVVYRRASNTGNMALVGSEGDIFAGDRIHGMFYADGSDNLQGFHGSNDSPLPTDFYIQSSRADQPQEIVVGVLRYGAGGAGGALANVTRINGQQTASNTAVESYVYQGVQIGADQMDASFVGVPGANFFDGDIAEVVLYANPIEDTDMPKIESYLAVKYGITLDQNMATDYVTAAGTPIWSATTASTYAHDIAGIGRDDSSELGQIRSKSNNSDAIVQLEAEGEGSNATPAFDDLDDTEFLMWSNNNGSATWSTTGAPAGYQVLGRQWLAQETSGETGLVTLTVDTADAEFDVPAFQGNLYLAKGADLTAQTPLAMTDAGSGLWTASGVDLDEGEFFTLAIANSVMVEFSEATVSSSDEATAATMPSVLVSGVLNMASSVNVVVTGGTATNGTDYTFTSPLILTLPAGVYDGTAGTAIAVTAPVHTEDAIVETGGETIEFTLDGATAGTLIGDADGADGIESVLTYTIADDDTVLVELAPGVSAVEGSTDGRVMLLVNGTVTEPTTVTVNATGGDAMAGDFSFTSPTVVTIPAGVYDGTAATAVPVPGLTIVNDSVVEGNEGLQFTVSLPTGDASLGDADGDNAIATTTTTEITNDDSVFVELAPGINAAEAATGDRLSLLVNGTVTAATTVTIDVTGGNATVDDYTFTSPTVVSIAPGVYDGTPATAVTVMGLSITDDAIVESDETLEFTVSLPTGDATLGDADGDGATATLATIEIANDDSVLVELAPGISAAENATVDRLTLLVNGTVTVATTVTIDVTGGDATVDDYSFTSPTVVNIAAGMYDGTPATAVPVPGLSIVDDVTVESDETVEFTVSLPTGDASLGDADGNGTTASTATIEITNDDSVLVELAPGVNANEAATIDRVTLLVNGTVTSASTVSISATGGDATVDDYSFTSPTVVTIDPGSYDGTAATAVVVPGLSIVDDAIVEGDESVEFTVSLPTGDATIGDANGDTSIASTSTIVIANDDAVLVELVTGVSVDESAASDSLSLLVVGTVTTATTVTVNVTGGDATGDDFSFPSPVVVTIPPGAYDGTLATAVLVPGLSVVDDEAVEATETIEFTLSLPVGDASLGDADGDATITTVSTISIVNDDDVSVEFAPDTSADESDGNNGPMLLVLGTVTNPSTVEILDFDAGSATLGDDYTFTSPAIVDIPAGVYDGTLATAIAVTGISVIDDAVVESDETISMEFGSTTGDVSIGDATGSTTVRIVAIHTIVNDDAVVVEMAADSGDMEASGGNAPMVLVRGNVLADTTVTITDSQSGSATAGVDYTFTTPQSITIAAGTYDGTAGMGISVPGLSILDDTVAELSETINFSLSAAAADVQLGDADGDSVIRSATLYTIENDDQLQVAFVSANFSAAESATVDAPRIQVTNGVIGQDQSIDVLVVPGDSTATAADYTLTVPVTITIPAGNYQTPATLLMSGLSVTDDVIDEADEIIALQLVNPSTGVAIAALGEADYTIADDDTAGVSFTVLDNLSSEDGDTATFTVVLDTEPTGDVVVSLLSDNTAEGNVASSATFSSADWNQPQTITVTGVDDSPSVVDGSQPYRIVTDIDDANSSAAEYVALEDADLADVDLQNQDNDAGSVIVTVVDGVTSEDGSNTATLRFTLGTEPAGDVIIPLSIDSAGRLEGSFAANSVVATSSVTVTAANWDTGVDVTVFGVDDDPSTVDGPQSFTVTTGDVAPGSDPAYLLSPAIEIADPVLTNTDDDAVSVSFVSPTTSGGEATGDGLPAIEVSGAFLIADQTVTVDVSGGSAAVAADYDSPAGSIALTVPAADYSTPVSFALPNLAVLDDQVDESDETIELTLTAVSADLTIGSVTNATHTIVDDDTAGVDIQLLASNLTSENGDSVSLLLTLTSEPTADVVVALESTNTNEGTVPATVTFTPANWNVPQTIVVSGVDDAQADGSIAYQIQTRIDAATVAAEYPSSLATPSVSLENQDNEDISIQVEVLDSLSGEDGSTAIVRFTLGSQPSNGDEVTIPLALDTADEAELAVSAITIVAADWNDPSANVVTITGLDDDSVDGTQAYRLLTGDPSSANLAYDALTSTDVADPELANADNDALIVGFAEATYAASENDSGVVMSLTVQGGIAPDALSIDLATGTAASDSASHGVDYSGSLVQTIVVPAGEYRTPTTIDLPPLPLIDDSLVEGDETVTRSLQNPDPGMGLDNNTLPVSTVLTIADNDTANYVVVDTVTEIDETGSGEFTVRLGSRPAEPVLLTLSVDDTAVATLDSAQFVFTSANWNQLQRVTLTGVVDEDFVAEAVVVSIAVDASSDAFFVGLPGQSFNVAVLEPDANTDADGDGLTNIEECTKTPCLDTDNDGTPDYLDEDDDNDGLSTAEELVSTDSDHLNADTDGDLVPDGVEVANGTPTGPAGNDTAALGYQDTDGDLVPDYIEVQDGTDPEDASDFLDTDNGGLPDYIEVTYFFNAGLAMTDSMQGTDDCRDLEGDGLPDQLELRLQSGLDDANSPTVDGQGDDDIDGVSNAVEAYLATLTLTDVDATTDFDRDGFPDAFEVSTCTQPLSAREADRDQDGVPDSVEARLGADIDGTTDSDGDGLPDIREIAIGSDWQDADGPTLNGDGDDDADGITNAIEAYLRERGGSNDTTNATDTDTDNIDDATEVRNNSNPFANLQPVVWIEAQQGNGQLLGINTIRDDGGTVSLLARIGNYNGGEREYDWSASDANVLGRVSSVANETLEFDPAGLAPGIYVLNVRVRRIVDGEPSPYSTVRFSIEVSDSVDLMAIMDSDEDGVRDEDDVSDGRLGRADELQSVAADTDYIVRSDRGTKLQLGSTARAASQAVTQVAEQTVAERGNGTGRPAPLGEAEEWVFPLGLHDFEIANLPEVGAIGQISIPQSQAIPVDAQYLKFLPGTGYVPFDTSTGDAVFSAPGQLGECPRAGDASFTEGLTAGHFCIALAIRDNGPNDADGELNGLVVDPAGVAIAADAPTTPVEPGTPGAAEPDGPVRTGLQGGGCSIGYASDKADPTLLLLVMLALSGGALRRYRRRVIQVVALGAALVLPSVGHTVDSADFQKRWYGGMGLGQSWLDPDTRESSRFDTNDRLQTGAQLLLGIDMSRSISIEGHAATLGSAGLSPNRDISYRELGVSGLYYVGKSSTRLRRTGWLGYGRAGLGVLFTDAAADVNLQQSNTAHVILGLGAEYALSNGFALRGEATTYDADVQYGQFSLLYRFGQSKRSAPTVMTAEKAEEPPVVAVSPVAPEPEPEPVPEPEIAAAVVAPLPVDECIEQIDASRLVGFDSGSAKLNARQKDNLVDLVLLIGRCNEVKVTIAAHTDSVGKAQANERLSKRRAMAVADYLEEEGIAPRQIDAQWFGESQPRESNDTPAGRRANRRVLINATQLP